jgi:two-component system chemotaxis response regulator CheB
VSVNVLVVDDSAVIRGLIVKALSVDPMIAIAGTASNGSMAVTMARDLHPDIIILDIEMPVMDGLTALPELLKVSPKSKVIMASTLTLRNAEISMRALELGATDYLAKPSAKFGQEVEIFYRDLIDKVRVLGGLPPALIPEVQQVVAPAVVAVPAQQKPLAPMGKIGRVQALAIASSTGGPQALLNLFTQMKGRLSGIPIFITQHMPPTFTTIMAEHISKAGERRCSEAKDGEVVVPGCAYLAPGDFHMIPEQLPTGEVVLRINQSPPENFCRPAADPMFRALSRIYGAQLLAAVLTGMGQDGMEGAKVIIEKGGNVIAQDEASCVVYGMPKAIVDRNLARAVLPLNDIGRFLVEQIEGRY